MADKVLRFSAEDSGYGATIDRMAQKVRTAFSQTTSKSTGIGEVLSEADAKFTSFADKVKYIRGELEGMKTSNQGEYGDRIAKIENSRESNATKNYLTGNVEREFKGEQKEVDRLITALDKLAEVYEKAEKEGGTGGSNDTIVDRVKKSIQPSGAERLGEKVGGTLGETGVGALFGSALGTILGNVAGKALGLLKDGLEAGMNQARAENLINRTYQYNSDEIGRTRASEIANLGVSGNEYLQAANATILSRRRGAGTTEETFNRLEAEHGAGIGAAQFAGLDRMMRYGPGGQLNNPEQLSSSRTVIELLQRLSKPGGIIDIEARDFALAPEKIEQLSQIMQLQYARSGMTDPQAIMSMIAAGQKIGGQFAGNQAGEVFGNLTKGLSDPSSPAMKAYLLATLQRLHPTEDQYELTARLQRIGTDKGDLQAIMGGLGGTRNKQMREAISASIFGATNMNQAVTFAAGGYGTLAEQSKVPLGTDAQARETQDKLKADAIQNTTTLDAITKRVENSVAGFGEAVSKFADAVNGRATPGDTGGAFSAGHNTNKVYKGSPSGDGRNGLHWGR